MGDIFLKKKNVSIVSIDGSRTLCVDEFTNPRVHNKFKCMYSKKWLRQRQWLSSATRHASQCLQTVPAATSTQSLHRKHTHTIIHFRKISLPNWLRAIKCTYECVVRVGLRRPLSFRLWVRGGPEVRPYT